MDTTVISYPLARHVMRKALLCRVIHDLITGIVTFREQVWNTTLCDFSL